MLQIVLRLLLWEMLLAMMTMPFINLTNLQRKLRDALQYVIESLYLFMRKEKEEGPTEHKGRKIFGLKSSPMRMKTSTLRARKLMRGRLHQRRFNKRARKLTRFPSLIKKSSLNCQHPTKPSSRSRLPSSLHRRQHSPLHRSTTIQDKSKKRDILCSNCRCQKGPGYSSCLQRQSRLTRHLHSRSPSRSRFLRPSPPQSPQPSPSFRERSPLTRSRNLFSRPPSPPARPPAPSPDTQFKMSPAPADVLSGISIPSSSRTRQVPQMFQRIRLIGPLSSKETQEIFPPMNRPKTLHIPNPTPKTMAGEQFLSNNSKQSEMKQQKPKKRNILGPFM